MQPFYTFIGSLIFLALAVAVFLGAWAYFFEKLNAFNAEAISAAREAGRRELANDIRTRTYWFSEHPEAQALLEEVGNAGQYGCLINYGELRNKWLNRITNLGKESKS